METFSDTIQDLGIIDLPLQGAQFTWSRGDNNQQKIDRFLISPEWSDSFKAVRQIAMPKVISDYRPILLERSDWDATPSYFKFENMWLEVEGFLDKLKNWWQNYNFNGRPNFIFMEKLRSLKKDITDWNKEEFGKLETRKGKALDELMLLEQNTEGRQLNIAEASQMTKLKAEIQQLAKIKEISWRQKSRCLWLKVVTKTLNIFRRLLTQIGDPIA